MDRLDRMPKGADMRKQKKNSVGTETRGGSETSLNTVVHENVKVYTRVEF